MDFITQCREELARRFNLSAAALQAEHLLVNADGGTLHVEFYEPADNVSVYSIAERALDGQSGELPPQERYTLLRQMLQTNADLSEWSLLRLYLDEERPGLAMDCSPLNCRDAAQFGAELQGLLDAQATLRNILV
ncbi:MAG: hypothetical protein OXI88_02790 [Gammaproteobacteria bacterium]|nr:hypothetical protein [Gammaproteobacteria bacterium]MDE0282962.1 hypothetical protein [Gammaproteobacteria bacterium]MDE0510699.1 hypothetical protein [Gammaproteobacteria bacterium]